MPLQIHIDIEFSGVGNGWTSIDNDLLRTIPITCDYGINGVTPVDRVASTGTLNFGLNNSEVN